MRCYRYTVHMEGSPSPFSYHIVNAVTEVIPPFVIPHLQHGIATKNTPQLEISSQFGAAQSNQDHDEVYHVSFIYI